MKRLKLLTLVMVAGFAWHCSGPIPDTTDDTTPTPPAEEAAFVKLDSGQSSDISVGYEKTEITFSFSTNKNWTAELSYGSGTASWLTLNTNNGKSGNYTLIATVSENPEETNRSAVVTIKAGDASANITISQNAFKSEFSIGQKVIEVEAAGGTIEVSVTSNIGYHASSGVDWIHEVGTKATQTRSLWFVVDANTSIEPRTGVIVICNDNEVCIPVEIKQAGATALISISSSILEFSSSSGEQTVEITSNANWTVSQKPQWCSLSPSSATGNATVNVIVTENGNAVSREGKIVFSVGSATAELSVQQQPGTPELEISDTEFSFAENGGEASFSITSNADWVVNTGALWLKASEESGTGNALVTLTAERNEKIEARTAQVTVRTKDGIIRKSITVSQTEGEPYLELNVYSLNFSYLEGKSEVSVSSNASWNVTSSDSWCTVEKNESSKSVSVCVKANDSGKNRSAQITVKTDKGGLEKTVTVSQSPLEDNEGFGDDGKINWN